LDASIRNDPCQRRSVTFPKCSAAVIIEYVMNFSTYSTKRKTPFTCLEDDLRLGRETANDCCC
jgi:hypothetical protein